MQGGVAALAMNPLSIYEWRNGDWVEVVNVVWATSREPQSRWTTDASSSAAPAALPWARSLSAMPAPAMGRRRLAAGRRARRRHRKQRRSGGYIGHAGRGPQRRCRRPERGGPERRRLPVQPGVRLAAGWVVHPRLEHPLAAARGNCGSRRRRFRLGTQYHRHACIPPHVDRLLRLGDPGSSAAARRLHGRRPDLSHQEEQRVRDAEQLERGSAGARHQCLRTQCRQRPVSPRRDAGGERRRFSRRIRHQRATRNGGLRW